MPPCCRIPLRTPTCLRLLMGPRWNVGLRDLALLGSRAAELADVEGVAEGDLEVQAQGRDGQRSIDIPALLDAVMDPGTIGCPGCVSRLASSAMSSPGLDGT